MVRPFIPFLLFPPYSHWCPNREASFPSNLQTLARLNELDVASQPFISTWYADRFLNWIAHNWNPATPHLQYNSFIQGLERMLNWTKDVQVTRENVADHVPGTLVFKEPKPRASISDETMNWMLGALQRLDLSTHDLQVISMYLIVARHSIRPIWQVLGTPSSPGRIDQFSRNGQGVWQEPHHKTGQPTPLPAEFGRAFERYLNYMNIDPKGPRPASSLFYKENSVDALVIKGLWPMTCSIRESLADLAQASNSPDIVRAADDIRSLTAAMVSGRSVTKP